MLDAAVAPFATRERDLMQQIVPQHVKNKNGAMGLEADGGGSAGMSVMWQLVSYRRRGNGLGALFH